MTPMPYHNPCQNGFYDIFSGYVRFVMPFQGKSLFVVGFSLFVSGFVLRCRFFVVRLPTIVMKNLVLSVR